MHKPLKGDFNEILSAVAMGSGKAKRAALKTQRLKGFVRASERRPKAIIYPEQLTPTAIENVKLPSGKTVQLAKATPVFKLWTGEPVTETYGGKAVLDFYGKPQFAELGILRIFENDGWQGVWVDTYQNQFRTCYWPKDSITLPNERATLLNAIYEANGTRSGCFDVFCWKGNDYIFIESKRCDQDKLRDTQKNWIDAAIKAGVPLERLLVVEWKCQ